MTKTRPDPMVPTLDPPVYPPLYLDPTNLQLDIAETLLDPAVPGLEPLDFTLQYLGWIMPYT
jgi:hypothetical protein